MPTSIIDQDCVILTIPGPPTNQKQGGYLIRQKKIQSEQKQPAKTLKHVDEGGGDEGPSQDASLGNEHSGLRYRCFVLQFD